MDINETGKIYHRPWGSYQTLESAENFQVKVLLVRPQGCLSLQKHAKRSEHWIIIAGTPTITINDEKKVYQTNDYIFIPTNVLHRIENFSQAVVKILELQTGSYFGEDDIVRIEDIYGRVTV